MRAIIISSPGAPEVLRLEERPIPVIKENEVLIKTAAAGVNRPDVFQRQGNYPAPEGAVQDIPGLEVSGIIEKTGSAVTGWKPGDEVCALVTGGGYAEYVAADAGSCLPIPRGISLTDAAALPEVLFTVWHNVFQRGNLKKGEHVLIYGGSGGIGSMAIQLVRLFGAIPYTLASSADKIDHCRSLGAERVINYKDEDLLSILGSESMDVILDSIGGDYFVINLDLMRPDGRLVYINAMEGRKAEIDIMKVIRKRLHITGSTLRARSPEFKKSLAQDILENAFPLLQNDRFKNMVSHRFLLEEAAEAHRLMESRNFLGKMILITNALGAGEGGR